MKEKEDSFERLSTQWNNLPRGFSGLEKLVDRRLFEKKLVVQKQQKSTMARHSTFMKEVHEVEMGLICQSLDDKFFRRLLDVLESTTIASDRKMVLFTLDQLNLKLGVIENGFIFNGKKRERSSSTIPSFIYNFAVHTNLSDIEKMRELRVSDYVTVINPVNVFDQEVIFDMIASVKHLADGILSMSNLTMKTFHQYLECFDTLLLVPQHANSTASTIIIKRLIETDKYELWNGKVQTVTKEKLLSIVKKVIKNRNYVLLTGVDLLYWKNGPLEIRTWVQKGSTGVSEILGITVKKDCLSKEKYSTCENVAIILEGLGMVTDVSNSITSFTIQSSHILDYYIPQLGSCSFDFFIDKKGNPYLIRVGGFDEYFLQFQDLKQPILYLNYLFNNNKQGV
jgi:hypothetical protein